KTITVRGANVISSTAITAAMVSKEGSVYDQAVVRADETRILDLGYFKDVKILTHQLSDTEVELVVEISENPIIREVHIVGNTVITTEELTKAVTEIQELGKIFSNRYRARIQAAVEELYSDKGYLVAIDRLQPHPESEGTLLVSIIEPRLREIRITGLVHTRESVIRRMMKTKPGRAFSNEGIQKDLENIYATRWFDDIKRKLVDTGEVGVYDLELEFFEARTGQINGGVALDPQSKLVGFVSYSDSNWRGLGQSVGVNLSQATVGGGASAVLRWSNPFMDSRDTAVSVSLYSRVVYNFSGNGLGGFEGPLGGSRFDERRTGGAINFARPFAKINRGNVGMKFENVRSLNLTSNTTGSSIQQDGDILSLQLGVDSDTRHPVVEPFEGQLASILVEPSYSNINKIGGSVANFQSILGPNYYLKTTLEFRKYWSKHMPADTPVTQSRPVVAFRAAYGFITGDVPFFEQNFVGGLGSVRGYQNQRFWGKQSLAGTLEYRYPIQRSFNLVGFVDYGGAWGGYPSIDTFSQTNSPAFHLGYGVGVSFRTPVGPIRIDFAFNGEGGSRTHFAFGTNF
ncbi:MAG TPA: BamA/TamA family outer membrane protein, partial [Fimbriimonadaceae bacterium]|nr:BamA/TamA family outer membrane protein [Fimbriimonadaceae bacterium]